MGFTQFSSSFLHKHILLSFEIWIYVENIVSSIS